jgi:hypothetical protein
MSDLPELTWTPDTARLDSLELWSRNPKRLSKARAERLLKSWRDMGQYQTLAIGPGGECYDGTQRVNTLKAAGYKGDYEVRVLRSNRPLTDTERERVIIESTVGTVGALDFDALSGWDDEALKKYGLDAEALAEWNDAAANLALMLESEGGAPDDTYTRKIEPPEYIPSTVVPPGIIALYDDSKTKVLIEAIDSCDSISDEEKVFLRAASQRHTVFDFENIAEYYAFASPEMQGLMEANVLVIVDFNAAIKQGFIKLNLEIADMVRDEYGDE